VHTWTGDLQSSAVRLTVAAGSEEAGRRKQMEQAAGVGRRCRVASGCGRPAGTRCSRGAAQRLVSAGQVRDGAEEPQGDATHRDAPTGVDAQRRRRQATGSLSLLSLPAVLRRVSLRALALFLSLLLFLSAPTAEGRESLSRAAFLPAQNPSHAGFVSRSGISVPAQAPRPLLCAAD